MDNSIYIIHRSVIIQNGLAELLSKRFKSRIKMFSSLEDFQAANETFTKHSFLLIEDTIALSKDYTHYIRKAPLLTSYSIISEALKEHDIQHKNHLSLYDAPDEIYRKLHTALEQNKAPDTAHQELSNREIEVLKLVALGYSNKEIADKLYISSHTVMSHRKNMTLKLGIKSISGLTVYAIINNYIDTTGINVNDLI